MSIGSRIKALRKELKLTLVELGELVGLNKSTIHRYELDLINIPSDNLERLAKALHTSPGYLMGWEDRVPLTKENYNAELPPSNVCMIDEGNIKMIPLFGSVSAGFGSCEDEYIGMIPIVKVGSVENYVAVTVRGDSMEDRIMDKSIVVVNKNVPIYDGEVGIFRVNDDVFVKQKIIKDKKTYLHSFNDYYEDIEIREYDYYVELGKVVETITKW